MSDLIEKAKALATGDSPVEINAEMAYKLGKAAAVISWSIDNGDGPEHVTRDEFVGDLVIAIYALGLNAAGRIILGEQDGVTLQ